MAIVTIRDGEPPEGILSRFRAAVTRGGILKEHKDRKFFRSKGEKERLAARRSARRRRRVTARLLTDRKSVLREKGVFLLALFGW
jgi:ribosomal protein S21